jgi:hypothetical protein
VKYPLPKERIFKKSRPPRAVQLPDGSVRYLPASEACLDPATTRRPAPAAARSKPSKR